MFRFALLAVTLGLAAWSQPAVAAKAKPTRAQSIVTAMVHSLSRQSRIVVNGQIKQGVKGSRSSSSYRLRYQATGREDIRAHMNGKGGIMYGGKVQRTTRSILIGTDSYSTVDGKHWFKGFSRVAPTPLDTIGINMLGATCCVATGVRKGESVWFERATAWNGHSVYKLGFKGSSMNGSATGTLYVDRGSHLPVHYDETTVSPTKSRGSFSLAYGGSFTIQAPK